MPSVKILVAYHKKDTLYKSDILVPVHCGRALMAPDDADRDWYMENLVGDDTGENISALNKDFCELTALYWAWKNYDKIDSPDYVGLAHYRRLWYLADDFPASGTTILDQIALTKENVEALLEKHPVIVPHIYQKESMSFKMFQPQMRFSETHYPVFYKQFQNFEREHRFYNCNMFIFPKEVFFEYCEMLFGALFDTKEYIEKNVIRVFPRYSGTVAEYLTSFYQMHLVAQNRYASKEQTVVFLDLPNAIKV
ncbi:MAG: DUF4422 domain-containing protein [Opitutales bacterium]|nr:DUF4422 domain-containing protein [Opitutales bacterium]